MKPSTKKFLLINLAIALFIGLVMATAIAWYIWHSFNQTNLNSSLYRPLFKGSQFELVVGHGSQKPHLFFQTNAKYAVGDKVESLKFLRVYKKTNSTSPAYHKDFLDNAVDALGIGYVVFNLEPGNFDCFAIYLNNHLVRYKHIEFSLLPTPSDAWQCAGYDFKQSP